MASEKSKQTPKTLGRRQFILGAGAGAAAMGAALVAKAPGSSETATTSDSGAGQKDGYRMTEHISNYYRTARV